MKVPFQAGDKTIQIELEKSDLYDFVKESYIYFHQCNPRHPAQLTPKEFVEAVLDYSVQQFGLLATTVLEYWKLNSPRDIGRVLEELVENGLRWSIGWKFSSLKLQDYFNQYSNRKLLITHQPVHENILASHWQWKRDSWSVEYQK